jgi:hypothetical protein
MPLNEDTNELRQALAYERTAVFLSAIKLSQFIEINELI